MPTLITFQDYNNVVLDFANPTRTISNIPGTSGPLNFTKYLEPVSVARDTEQTLNIGSQSSGAGAGKVTFNPLQLAFTDLSSFEGKFFQYQCSGVPFKWMSMYHTVLVEGGEICTAYYKFSLVAIKDMSYTADSDTQSWSFTLEYGALNISTSRYDGSKYLPFVSAGWDRVKNILWNGVNPLT